MFGAKVNHFLQIRTNNVDIHKNFYQALPFGQSFLSAAVRIGSLAVRMAAFSCAWVWRSGRGGLHGTELRCGAVASALLRQSRDVAEALSEMFLVAPCALSEGRAQSLGLLQYSQHCHRSLIRARCGWLLLRFYHRQ